jgi:enamine deaminase RidA (YjgF/YER057c/UK114 family)
VQYIGAGVNRGSDAVVVDNVSLVHTKQFLPIDKNGEIVGENNLARQIDQIFSNISQALKESGSTNDQIIKLNVFITKTDLMNEVRSLISAKFHSERQPSITLAPGELTRPDALVSIDAVAVSKYKKERVKLSRSKTNMEASSAILPAGPVIYVSGQAAKGELAEATKETLKQLWGTLTYLGLSMDDVVQIKSFLTPMSSLSIVQKELADFFKGEKMPPLVFVEWVSANPVIEIELIASAPVKAGIAEQIEYITPPGMVPSPVYSKVSRLNYGRKVYLSGIYGVNSGTVDSEVNSIFGLMDMVLKASGSSFNSLLKATYYVGSDQFSKSLGDLRPKYYDPKSPPAASKAMLKGVGLNEAGISIDMIGAVKE